jgi:CRP-like cAMP-binding protein
VKLLSVFVNNFDQNQVSGKWQPFIVDISRFIFTSKSLFESLPIEDIRQFKSLVRLKKIKKGKVLFQEGSYPKGLYILKRGKVKLFQQLQSGSEQIVYIYSSGDIFGYRPLLCHDRHPASAKTLEECGIYFLAADHFFSILKKSTGFSNLLLENLSHEFSVLVNHIAAFGQRSVKERMALSLLILAEKYRNGEILVSRTDLASFVGTTIETVARIVTRLKQDKIINVNGRRIAIVDREALVAMSE